MAFTYRAAGTASNANNGTSLTPGLPTGWQPGDLAILQFSNYGGTGARTPGDPDGWTPLYNQTHTGRAGAQHVLWYRILQSGDSAPTLTLSGTGIANDTQLSRIYAWSCASGFLPRISVTGTASSNLASADNVGPAPGINANADEMLIIAVAKTNDWNGTATLTNFTLATAVNESTTGNDAGQAILYDLTQTGGATGDLTVTDNGGTASAGFGFAVLFSVAEAPYITPSVGSIGLTGIAPTVTVADPNNTTITPSTGSLAISGRVFTDNFNRANGNIGSDWTVVGSDNTPQIVSNRLERSTSGKARALYTANGLHGDQEVSVIVSGSNGGYIGVGARITDSSGFTGYEVIRGPSDGVAINRYAGGSGVSLGGVTGISFNGTTDRLGIRVIGNLIMALKNGAVVYQALDNTYTTGYASVILDNDGSTPWADDFEAREVTGPGVTQRTIPTTGVVALTGNAPTVTNSGDGVNTTITPSTGAINFSEGSVSLNNTTSGQDTQSTTLDISVNRAAGEGLLLGIYQDNSFGLVGTISSVKWDPAGVNEDFTLVHAGTGGANRRVAVWYIANPTGTGTKTVRVNLPGNDTGQWFHIRHIKGHDTASMVRGYTHATGDSGGTPDYTTTPGTKSLNVTTVAGDLVVDFIGLRDHTDYLSAGSGDSNYVEQGGTDRVLASATRVATGTTTTVQKVIESGAGGYDSQWTGVAIKPGAGGIAPTVTQNIVRQPSTAGGRNAVHTDDFNRANGPLTGPYDVLGGGINIFSNAITNPSSNGAAFYNGSTWADGYVQVKNVTSPASPGFTALVLRYNTGTGNGYFVGWDSTGCSIRRVDASVPTTIGAGNFTSPGAGVVVTALMVGNTISLYYDGVFQTSRTDSTHTAAAQWGVSCLGTDGIWDDLEVGTATAGLALTGYAPTVTVAAPPIVITPQTGLLVLDGAGTSNVGNTGIGGTTGTFEQTFIGIPITVSQSGWITGVAAYLRETSSNAAHGVKAAVLDSSGNKLAEGPDSTPLTTTAGWVTLQLTAPLAVTAGQSLVVGVANSGGDGSVEERHGVGASGDGKFFSITFPTIPASNTLSNSTSQYSIYAVLQSNVGAAPTVSQNFTITPKVGRIGLSGSYQDFIFSQANGTTLETIDSKWAGDTALYSVQNGRLQCSAIDSGLKSIWYENGQPLRQSSKLVRAPGAASGNSEVFVQRNGSQLGYKATIGTTHVEIRRGTTYKVDAAHGVNLATTELTVEIATTTGAGGLALVSVYVQNNPTALVTWQEDVADLTGGYPGFFLANLNAVTNEQAVSWTDNYSPGLAPTVSQAITITPQTGALSVGAPSGTFGRSTLGPGSFPNADGRILVSKYTLPTSGTVSKLTAFFDYDAGETTSAGSSAKAIIYADSGGNPAALMAVGTGVALGAGDQQVDLPISVYLPAGDYWLGIVANNFQQRFNQTESAGSSARKESSYASPVDPFGTPAATYTSAFTVYATYEQSTAPTVRQNTTITPQTGKLSIGGAPISRGTSPAAVNNSASSATVASDAFVLTAGNQLVIGVKWEGTEQGIDSIVDTAGNTFVPLTPINSTANSLQLRLYYVEDAIGHASNIVTVTFLASANYRSLEVIQLVNGDPNNFLVAEGVATEGSGTAFDLSAAFSAGDYAYALLADFAGTTATWDAGWSERIDSSTNGSHSADRLDSPGGTYAPGGDLATSAAWIMVAASFRAAAAGSAPVVSIQGGGNTTITPSTGVINVTGVAGTAGEAHNRTPQTGVIALTGVAPVVTRQDTIVPGTGTITLSGNNAQTGGQVTIQPSTGAINVSGNAPVVGRSWLITPQTGALTTAGQQAAVTRQENITPATGNISLAGVAPVVTRQDRIVPQTGNVSVAGAAPVLSTGIGRIPQTGSVALSGNSPTVTQQFVITPQTGAITTAGVAPTILRQDRITPQTGSISLNGNPPQLAGQGTTTPNTGAIALAGNAPVVNQTFSAHPTAGAVSLAGNAPTVSVGVRIVPDTGSITVAGVAPVLAGDIRITPQTGAVVVSGVQANVTRDTRIVPTTGAIAVNGIAPSVTRQDRIVPTTGSVTLAGSAPELRYSWYIVPQTGVVSLVGEYPNLGGTNTIRPSAGNVALVGQAPILAEGKAQTASITITGSIAINGSKGAATTTEVSAAPDAASVGAKGAQGQATISLVSNISTAATPAKFATLTITGVTSITASGSPGAPGVYVVEISLTAEFTPGVSLQAEFGPTKLLTAEFIPGRTLQAQVNNDG